MKKVLAIVLAVIFSLLMGLTAFATEYKPSVEQKEAPELISETVEVTDPVTGETTVVEDAVATVNIDTGIVDALSWRDVIVTPLARKDEAKYESITEALAEADRALKANRVLPYVSERYIKKADDTFERQSQKLLKQVGYDIGKYTDRNSAFYWKSYEKLVVRDLFDISLFGDIVGIKQPDGSLLFGTKIVTEDGTILEDNKPATVVVKLNVQLSPDEPTPVLIFKCDMLEEWETMPSANVVRNADGSMTVTFERFCVVALLTAYRYTGEDDTEVTAPETGVTEVNHTHDVFALFAVVCFVAAGTLRVMWAKKKRHST